MASFNIDPHSGVPIYLQLIEQVKRSVALGVLVPGEQLPTVKQLALDLTINANTVGRVYRELERDGVIETSPGRGSFVRDNGGVGRATRAVEDVASAAIDGAVREAKSIGIDADNAVKLFRKALARWYPGLNDTNELEDQR
ncbi:MAG TPA: GntR family transcriptional regulator [Candidatus Eremiobacteraceae bacterium]|nr:GntR family transcriptional regulator [Candidatus Eremiobacteraceae bacterium]